MLDALPENARGGLNLLHVSGEIQRSRSDNGPAAYMFTGVELVECVFLACCKYRQMSGCPRCDTCYDSRCDVLQSDVCKDRGLNAET